MGTAASGAQRSTTLAKMGNKDSAPVLRDEDVAMLAETSGLGEEDVREQFNAFITEHPKGKMKKKDFGEMMKKALPQRDDADKMEQHMFRVYDANVDFVEFMMIYYIMSDGSPEEVLAKIFRVFDVNSDGTISEKELKRLIKDMFMMIKEENPEEASKEFITSSTFAEMDEDQNGKVTLDEFTTAILAREQFSKMLTLKIIDIFVEEE